MIKEYGDFQVCFDRTLDSADIYFGRCLAPEHRARLRRLDRLMPHPVYAGQSWACVLNPSTETFESSEPLLAVAYTTVKNREARRVTHD